MYEEFDLKSHMCARYIEFVTNTVCIPQVRGIKFVTCIPQHIHTLSHTWTYSLHNILFANICAETHYNTLQHTATHYNTLQHTITIMLHHGFEFRSHMRADSFNIQSSWLVQFVTWIPQHSFTLWHAHTLSHTHTRWCCVMVAIWEVMCACNE